MRLRWQRWQGSVAMAGSGGSEPGPRRPGLDSRLVSMGVVPKRCS